MQFLRTTMLSIVNFCLPLVRKSRDEPDAESPDLLQEILRMDVEEAMWEASLKMYEHERLKEYFENLAKDLRRGYSGPD